MLVFQPSLFQAGCRHERQESSPVVCFLSLTFPHGKRVHLCPTRAVQGLSPKAWGPPDLPLGHLDSSAGPAVGASGQCDTLTPRF